MYVLLCFVVFYTYIHTYICVYVCRAEIQQDQKRTRTKKFGLSEEIVFINKNKRRDISDRRLQIHLYISTSPSPPSLPVKKALSIYIYTLTV